VHQAYGRNYQLPNITAHGETCANIGNLLWNWRMFLVTGEARFMDIVELALYNSVLSGVSLDGTNFFYVNALRVIDPLPVELRWSRTRVPFVSSFCCPPNLLRTIAEVGDYAYGKSENAIWVNLYGGSKLKTNLSGGATLRLKQETEYPWKGQVRLTIEECENTEFALMLRIPGWVREAAIRINKKFIDGKPIPSGYHEVRRLWRVGDVVELNLPMPVRLMEANPYVEETLNQVAIQRGPVVYCLESPDLPPGISPQDVMIPTNIRFVSRKESDLLGGIVTVEGKVRVRSADRTDRLYREYRSAMAGSFQARFIPYYVWANRGPAEMTVWLPLYSTK
jgi:uncharacterized protein